MSACNILFHGEIRKTQCLVVEYLLSKLGNSREYLHHISWRNTSGAMHRSWPHEHLYRLARILQFAE